ncbi:MAG: HEAT repeat domain-containing protein [Dehalococcoidia bacterium]|jgi:HEAT repeat protein|nr:HEAT repeat domain-containing protein [Vicinamibacterales bacterium]MDP6824156.1 HEAT repeat domain-containing protein [Dehalococcoidia bacterium]
MDKHPVYLGLDHRRPLTWCWLLLAALLAFLSVACGAREDISLNVVRHELSRGDLERAGAALLSAKRHDADLIETIRGLLSISQANWRSRTQEAAEALHATDAVVRELSVRDLAGELDDRSFERMMALVGQRDFAVERLVAALADRSAAALESVTADATYVALLARKCLPVSARKAADAVLEKLGNAAFEPLVASLSAEDESIRAAAVAALGRLGDPRAVAPLAGLVGAEEDFGVLYELPLALGRFDGIEAARALASMLELQDDRSYRAPSGQSRAQAIRLVRMMIPRHLAVTDDLLPLLLGRLGDDNAYVVERARECLVFLGRTAVPATLQFAAGEWQTTPLSVVAVLDERSERERRVAMFTQTVLVLVELREPTMMDAEQRSVLVSILDTALDVEDLRDALTAATLVNDGFYAPTGVPNKGLLARAAGTGIPPPVLNGSGAGLPMPTTAVSPYQKMGGYIVDSMTARLDSDELRVRVTAAKTLEAIRDSRPAQVLVARIRNEREAEPLVAMVGAAAAIKIREAFPVLVDLLDSPRSEDPRVRMATISAIAAIGDKYRYPEAMDRAVERIRELTLDRDERESVRTVALKAFATMKPDGVALDVRRILLGERESDTLRKTAAFTLGELGAKAEEVVPAIEEVLRIRRDERSHFLRRIKRLYGDEETLNERWEALGWKGGYGSLRDVKVIVSLIRSEIVHAYRKVAGADAAPLLIKVLEDDQRAVVRQAAAFELGELHAGTDALIDSLESDDVGAVRASAAAALGKIKGEAVVQPLLKAMREDDYETTRRNAAVGIRSIAARAAVVGLVDILMGRHMKGDVLPVTSVFNEAAVSLIEDGKVAGARELVRDEVMRMLEHADARVRAKGLIILGSYVPPGILDVATQLLRDPAESATVRDAAVFVLGQVKDPRAIPTLLALLQDQNELSRIRRRAAWALGTTVAEEATPTLLAALEDPYPPLRSTAASALRSIAAEEAVPHLARVARDRGQPQSVRISAIAALTGFPGQTSSSTLMELLGHQRGNVRMAAAAAAGVLKPEGGVPALAAILRNRGEHDDMRRVAAVAMGEYGGRAADVITPRLMDDTERKSVTINVAGRIDEHYVFWESLLWASRALPLPEALLPRLQAWLDDEWYPIHFRRQVPRPLGAVDHARSSEVLAKALEHEDPFLRRVAVTAVPQTKDASFILKLIAVSKNATIVEERREVPLALGGLGDPAAVSWLEDALRSDADETVRKHAAIALGSLSAVDVLARQLTDDTTTRVVLIQVLNVLKGQGIKANEALPTIDALRKDYRADVALAARQAYAAISAAQSGGA